jgi:hypothetical protein
MKNPRVIILAVLFAICHVGAFAEEGRNSYVRVRNGPSGIQGVVVWMPGGDGVAQVRLEVATSSGKYLTIVNTSPDGKFEVWLKPGTYILTPSAGPFTYPGGLTSNVIIMGPPDTVRVRDHAITKVEVPLSLN